MPRSRAITDAPPMEMVSMDAQRMEVHDALNKYKVGSKSFFAICLMSLKLSSRKGDVENGGIDRGELMGAYLICCCDLFRIGMGQSASIWAWL